VHDMDQLYAQAAGLKPLLLSKVKYWATLSKGCFKVQTDSGGVGRSNSSGGSQYQFKRWDQLADSQFRVSWPALKGLQRAVEKLHRCYNHDASRLLDVCRASIAFRKPSELATCLRAIAVDSDVQLLSSKNRLAPDYNAESTGGYRDVNLTLRVITEEASTLGLDMHLCEVQLLLVAFAEVKSDKGHKHYVEFRDAQGM